MAKKIIFKHEGLTHHLFVGYLPTKPFFVADEITLRNEFRIPFIRENNITTLFILHDSPPQKNMIDRVKSMYEKEGVDNIAVNLFLFTMGDYSGYSKIFRSLREKLSHENVMILSFDDENNSRFFLALFLIFLGKKVNSALSMASALFQKRPFSDKQFQKCRNYFFHRDDELSRRREEIKEEKTKSTGPAIFQQLSGKISKLTFRKTSEDKATSGAIHISLRTKLISSVAGIIVVSMMTMILLATYFFKQDNVSRVLENNLNFANLIAEKVRSDVENLAESGSSIMLRGLESDGNRGKITIFPEKSNILMIGFFDRVGMRLLPANSYFNKRFQDSVKLDQKTYRNILAKRNKSLLRTLSQETMVINVSPLLQRPAAAVTVPVSNLRGMMIIVAMEHFYRNFKTMGVTDALLVNSQGELLVHRDSSRVQMGMVILNDPVVREMLTSTVDSKQIRYDDNEGNGYLASFSRVGLGSLGVIARVPEKVALSAVYNIQERNIYILIIVLNIAGLFLFFFARSLTRPIISLARATEQIKRGEYHVDLKPVAMDEIGLLTESFISMGHGLEERERIKDAFGKFVNREIAEEVIKGDLSLGGSRVQSVIMFSDIRAFTAMSENMEPEMVVEILNAYLTRMVACIDEGKGVVDKFIGDALMALWGVPTPSEDNALNAIDTALEMRKALITFNEEGKKIGRPSLQNGCGISSGIVVAGKIGSSDRMEYTVIGKSVNMASRIEALNKPFGTDILITADVFKNLQGKFITEKMQQVKVKGREEALEVYAVLGRRGDANAPATLTELQRRLGLKASDNGTGNDGIEEVKYRIVT